MNFGVDNFNEQKVLTSKDTIAQLIKNLMFMKPGNMPSMPHLGIDIQSKLYSFEEDLDTESLKKEIQTQCSEIIPYLEFENINLTTVKRKDGGQPILLIVIPFLAPEDNKQEEMIIGIQRSTQGDIGFNYDFREIVD